MVEDVTGTISRRDLLRKGAVLGGAVMWATPMVQTLGMGKAFAQAPSPATGADISYIGINVDCPGTSGDFFVKWETDEGDWEAEPGSAPKCSESVSAGMHGGSLGFEVTNLTGPCADISIPSGFTGCEITVWVNAGQTCNTYDNLGPGTHTVCSAP